MSLSLGKSLVHAPSATHENACIFVVLSFTRCFRVSLTILSTTFLFVPVIIIFLTSPGQVSSKCMFLVFGEVIVRYLGHFILAAVSGLCIFPTDVPGK